MTHEWDWPPTQRRYRKLPTRSRFDVYEPSGWNSPIVKKIVSAYFHVTITAIKMLLAVPLSLMLIGSLWLLWVLITL